MRTPEPRVPPEALPLDLPLLLGLSLSLQLSLQSRLVAGATCRCSSLNLKACRKTSTITLIYFLNSRGKAELRVGPHSASHTGHHNFLCDRSKAYVPLKQRTDFAILPSKKGIAVLAPTPTPPHRRVGFSASCYKGLNYKQNLASNSTRGCGPQRSLCSGTGGRNPAAPRIFASDLSPLTFVGQSGRKGMGAVIFFTKLPRARPQIQ